MKDIREVVAMAIINVVKFDVTSLWPRVWGLFFSRMLVVFLLRNIQKVHDTLCAVHLNTD